MPEQRDEESDLRIVDLSVERPSQWAGNCFPLLAEVRFGSADVTDDEDCFSVEFGIKKAFLKLELQGCRIRQGSRKHDPANPSELIRRIASRESRQHKREGSIRGSIEAEISKYGLALGTSGNLTAAQIREEEATQERIEITRAVSALQDGRWEILAVEQDYLRGLYVEADPPLCEIEVLRSKGTRLSASIAFKAVSQNI